MYKLIIQGFPRTGTTKMWSMCKKLTGHRMYYEPGNAGTALGSKNDIGNIHKIPLSNEYQDIPTEVREQCTTGDLWGKYLSKAKQNYYIELSKYHQPCGMKEFGFMLNLVDVRNTLSPNGKLILTIRSPEAIWASVNFYKDTKKGSLDNFMMHYMWEYIEGKKYSYIKKAKAGNAVHKFIAVWYYFNLRSLTGARYWGEDALIVRFEDLCNHPKEQLQEIAEFLDVDAGDLWTGIKPKIKDKWKEHYNSTWFYKRVSELGLTNSIGRLGYGKHQA